MATRTLRSTLPPVSIRQSFGEGLPDLPLGKNDPNAKVDEGAPTTQNMPPPTFAFPRHTDQRWCKLGRASLDPYNDQAYSFVAQLKSVDKNIPMNKEIVDFAKAFAQDKYFVPETEENITHASEADVVRSVNLYLIHPVLQALTAFPRYHRSVITKAEDYQASTRTDLAFYIPDDEGKAGRPFAIAEYKKRQTFTPDDFDHKHLIETNIPSTWGTDSKVWAEKLAEIIRPKPCGPAGQDKLKEASATFDELVQNYSNKTRDNLMESMNSAFEGNAENVIKQAASYMKANSVRHVVVCNWDCVVLCYFPWLDQTRTPGELKEYYRVRDKMLTRNVTKKEVRPYPVEVDAYKTDDPNLRLALLAFLQQAWEETRMNDPSDRGYTR